MTNQPWQERFDKAFKFKIKAWNPDEQDKADILRDLTQEWFDTAFAQQVKQFISELSKEQFTAGYKAGREEILKWAEEKKNKRSYAEMCNLSDYEAAKVNGQDNLLEELQKLINKDEK